MVLVILFCCCLYSARKDHRSVINKLTIIQLEKLKLICEQSDSLTINKYLGNWMVYIYYYTWPTNTDNMKYVVIMYSYKCKIIKLCNTNKYIIHVYQLKISHLFQSAFALWLFMVIWKQEHKLMSLSWRDSIRQCKLLV